MTTPSLERTRRTGHATRRDDRVNMQNNPAAISCSQTLVGRPGQEPRESYYQPARPAEERAPRHTRPSRIRIVPRRQNLPIQDDLGQGARQIITGTDPHHRQTQTRTRLGQGHETTARYAHRTDAARNVLLRIAQHVRENTAAQMDDADLP